MRSVPTLSFVRLGSEVVVVKDWVATPPAAGSGTEGTRLYNLSLALLCGVGVTSLWLLLLRVAPTALLSGVLSIFLLPGFLLGALLWRSREFAPPLAVLALNALTYSAIALSMLLVFCRGAAATTMRRVTMRVFVPAVILTGLACIPALNPLWPRGMAELTKQERELQEAFPSGMHLSDARGVLRSSQIRFQERTETAETVVWSREDRRMTAVAGDRVAWARLQTEARQFPCSYEIEVILIFGPDERLKDRHIERSRVCP